MSKCDMCIELHVISVLHDYVARCSYIELHIL